MRHLADAGKTNPIQTQSKPALSLACGECGRTVEWVEWANFKPDLAKMGHHE